MIDKPERLPERKRPAAPDRWTLVFVWGIWASLLIAALLFGREYAPRLPWCEEWYYIVPALTGERPVTIAWLWQPEGEHRVALPKLLWLALIKATGDFTVGMYFNVFALGMLALLMILTARKLRGRTSYMDAFFPFALLNWGQWPNLLTTFQLHQVVPVFLAGTILVLIARGRTPLWRGQALLAGLCLILLPFCGSVGLVHVPALSFWLAYSGVLALRAHGSERKTTGLLMLMFAAVALAFFAFYFVGLSKAVNPGHGRNAPAVLSAASQFLSLAFGPASRALWPYSAVVVAGLLLFTVAGVVTGWRARRFMLDRAVGFLSFMAASACLALAVGYGRFDGLVDDGRYVTFGALSFCGVYLIWVVTGGPSGRFVQMLLFTLVCAAFSFNTDYGLRFATWLRNEKMGFEQDLQAGVPAEALAERYVGRTVYFPSALDIETDKRLFAAWWRRARQSGIGPLRSLQPIEGAIESVTVDRISGWGWDMDRPQEAIKVDVYANDKLIGTVPADQFREALENEGVGDGRHGFSLPAPTLATDGMSQVIRAEIAGSGHVFAVGLLAADDGIEGKLETGDGNTISGWARDRHRPENRIGVNIFADNTLIGSVTADQSLEHLRKNGIGDGSHGFRLPIPEALRDGKVHIITAKVAGTERILGVALFLAPARSGG